MLLCGINRLRSGSVPLRAFTETVPNCDRTSQPSIIYCNFPEIDDGVYGNYANKTHLSFPYQVRSVNLGLMDLAATLANFLIADLSALQNGVGDGTSSHRSFTTTSGFVYALDSWPEIANMMLDIILSLQRPDS